MNYSFFAVRGILIVAYPNENQDTMFEFSYWADYTPPKPASAVDAIIIGTFSGICLLIGSFAAVKKFILNKSAKIEAFSNKGMQQLPLTTASNLPSLVMDTIDNSPRGKDDKSLKLKSGNETELEGFTTNEGNKPVDTEKNA